jgi:hypothetical protein
MSHLKTAHIHFFRVWTTRTDGTATIQDCEQEDKAKMLKADQARDPKTRNVEIFPCRDSSFSFIES